MKCCILLLIAILFLTPPIISQIVEFPDSAMLEALIREGVDSNGDGQISYDEAEATESLVLARYNGPHMKARSVITDLSGIEAFVNLDSLDCSYTEITTLDVSGNLKLRSLKCKYAPDFYSRGKLSSIDISKNVLLTELNCRSNQLTSLDVSNNPALERLLCDMNQIGSLDISNNLKLKAIFCGDNPLGSLDVSNNKAITHLLCDNNDLSSLDVSECVALTTLFCRDNQIDSLDLSKNPALWVLYCSGNSLSALNVSNRPALENMFCEDNQLSSLDVSNCTALEKLVCENNILSNLDITNCTALITLKCNNNQLDSMDVSNCTNLKNIEIANNPDLSRVCVWTMPFPPLDVNVDTSASPNVFFTSNSLGNEIADNKLSELKIFPNPSGNFLSIEFEYPDTYLVKISALNGEQLSSTRVQGCECTIDLSSFSKGVYIITIWSEDFVGTRKVVKL